ncbi:ATP-binding protein [Prosthecodimorpha staleyi]|uniref:histidine kinase n=1 Tax=Prosthecodimorpha staleyi TaxID=2840188 RepID=A0A947GJJ3_9HYPH|nr:ATP-binding protein [Prosthecodimorpha staleyi]MBT9291769.1 response regulator [Prosthecodimorpha staleyi]
MSAKAAKPRSGAADLRQARVRRAVWAAAARLTRPAHAERRDLAARIERLQDEVWTLREEAERWRSVTEAAGDLILRCDAARRVRFVNEAFATTFGVDGPAVVGADADALLHRFGLDPGHEAAMAAGDRLMRTTAGAAWYALVESPVAGRGGEGDEIQITLRDVGDRRAFETELSRARDLAEAASAAKSRFLAMASHEIRTPLNGIVGMADLMAETQLSSEQQAYLRAIRTSGEALLSLVEDVLDFSKIEAGRLDLAPAPAGLEPMVEAVIELVAPRAQARGIELAAHVAADVPLRLVFDEARLRQVLINLAGNAVKFTERGGVAVTVARLDGRADRACLRFEVTDTGIGIAPEHLDRIFNEYEQAESGPARRYGGTGLGLAISRAIIERMGSRIEVESKPGRGSSFAFDLDLPIAEPPTPARPLAGRRILVVSPGLIDPVQLSRRLADLGADAMLAVDATAARAALAEPGGGYDALLVDHRADFDAGRLLAALGRNRPPAAVIVAPADRAALERLKAGGFGGWLVKPVRQRSLAMVVAALAEGRAIANDATDIRVPAARAERAGTGPLRILVADDNAINALLARALLASLGHETITVSDGALAVEAVAAAARAGMPFEAILMDLHMPGLDGYAAIRAIRAAETAAGRPRVAILAVTADTAPEVDRDVRQAGADARLIKPVEPQTLSAVLDQIVLAPRAQG